MGRPPQAVARMAYGRCESSKLMQRCSSLPPAEWAALELAGGNQFKALGVVAKGLKEAAQPARWVLGFRLVQGKVMG